MSTFCQHTQALVAKDKIVLTTIFLGGPGLAFLILLLHLFLNCASFWDRPKLSTSFLTQSHQVFFWVSSLIPLTSCVIQHLTQSLSSFRSTCPNHLNLLVLLLIITLTGSNPKSSLSYSLFFLSFSLTAHIHLIRTYRAWWDKITYIKQMLQVARTNQKTGADFNDRTYVRLTPDTGSTHKLQDTR